MPLTTRNLTNVGDPLVNIHGDPLVGIKIHFYLVDAKSKKHTSTFDALTGERVVGTYSATTDASGEFTIALWPNDRGNTNTRYLCHVEAENVADIYGVVTTGVGSMLWIDFYEAGVPLTPAQLTLLLTHIADDSRHLTAAQNTFMDALNLPTLTAAHVNFVTGLTANAQAQFNNLYAADLSILAQIQALGTPPFQSQHPHLDGLSAPLGTGWLRYGGLDDFYGEATIPWADISGAPVNPVDVAPGADGGVLRSNGAAWVRVSGLPQADVVGLSAALALLAPLASPALTGNPTTPNQAAGSANTRIANTAYVDSAIALLLGTAPGLLDTLGEISDALGDDPNFATTIVGLINDQGLPVGGTLNDVLVKNSGTNYDASWTADVTLATLEVSTLTVVGGASFVGVASVDFGNAQLVNVGEIQAAVIEVDGFPVLTTEDLVQYQSGGTNVGAPGDYTTVNFTGDGIAAGDTFGALWVTLTGNVAQLASLAAPGDDRLLFWDDSAGSLAYLTLGANLSITGTVLDATGGGGVPGGSNQQLQYNNAGAFGGVTGALWDGTTFTLPNNTFVGVEDAGTNTVLSPFNLLRTSSGAPAAGIGVGMNFYVETAAGNIELGAAIRAVTADVTAASEDFDLVFYTMDGGATAQERGRYMELSGGIFGLRLMSDLGAIAYLAAGTYNNEMYLGGFGNYANGNTHHFNVRSDGGFGWSSNTTINGNSTIDLSILRSAANVARIANGSTGLGKLLYGVLVEANTAGSGAPNVLTAAESWTVLTNEGAGAENYHSLPSAVSGLVYVLVCENANGIRATAASGDKIKLGAAAASATAGYIKSVVPGSVALLFTINATDWYAMSIAGTWTVDS